MHFSHPSILSAAVTIGSLLGVASAAPGKSTTGLTQMIVYVKRHPDYTREEFWKYWGDHHAPKVAPLASHFNITRYQQVKVGGLIPPTAAGSEPASDKLVEFDGIAMFLYEKDETLVEFLAHPYYTEIVQPDERIFIDQEAFGAGQVAVFTGFHNEVVNNAKDVWVGDEKERRKYKKMFDSYN